MNSGRILSLGRKPVKPRFAGFERRLLGSMMPARSSHGGALTAPDDAIYAHSLRGAPRSQWETLQTHAEQVAALARGFASAFGAGDWGALLGRWHDLGKASQEFQQYIRATGDPDAGEERTHSRIDHSTFGAQHASRVVGGHFGQLLAYCIAGHHGSIPDAFSDDETTRPSTLHARLRKEVPTVLPRPEDSTAPRLKLPFVPSTANLSFQIAFFTRMIFSALIDADRLATEQFCNPSIAALRKLIRPGIAQLEESLHSFLERLQLDAPTTTVNRCRAQVRADCRTAAELAPGLFSLTVPTGGGKTFASLEFALRHARIHGMRRVVVAIPFTSIIEQTADAYRGALGGLAGDAILEHHSNIDPRRDTRQNKQAAENWDAPLIVTTNVQLYESLFAARGTSCRKLHRLANSVIILDEAQTIPVELLRPTLQALRELVTNYGCSVVLCTATQPALEWRERDFELGLRGVRPIIGNVASLFAELRRVQVTRLGRLGDDRLAERVAAERAVLCIVNTRPHAAQLFNRVREDAGQDGCYHLSTHMCAQHRREKLAEIRQRLRQGLLCRLIATQLIEAGVDVDFPVVYRAPAGFDSVAQAAGRCNREGRLQKDGHPALGRVFVFETDSLPPPGLLRSAAQCGRELSERFSDPIAPDAVEAYFRLFYWSQKHNWDKYEVLDALHDDFRSSELHLKFRTAAERYQVIRDEQTSILVPYNDEARSMRARLARNDELDFIFLRMAQRYLVGVRDKMLTALADAGAIREHASGIWWLAADNDYSADTGLLVKSDEVE